MKAETEKEETLAQCVRAIQEAVSKTHGLTLSTVCLLKPRSIPKTTSGKIARSWCRRGFLQGTLQIMRRADAEQVPAEMLEGVNDDAMDSSTSGKKAVGTLEVEDAGQTAPVCARVSATEPMTRSQIDAMTLGQVVVELETLLLQIASSAHADAPAQKQLPKNTPLTALGMDSMTIVQFKGVIDKKYVLFLLLLSGLSSLV